MNGKVITLKDYNVIRKLKFNWPQQVICHFEGDEEGVMSAGIAYGKEVICMCCGAVMSLDAVDFLQYDPEIWCNESDNLREDLIDEFEVD